MHGKMNISVNGQSRVPPGFRFHPTEEELLQYYLRKKIANDKIDLDVILEVDLNKLEPWDIQERCKIGTTPQNDWYFFSHKDKKYPTGTRTNRATAAGFWKATGRDKAIYCNSKRIGMRKTLVFYKGRAPHGLKSDWIMHEYRIDETTNNANDILVTSLRSGDIIQEGWVVCRIFKKKNHVKALDIPINTSNTISSSCMLDSPIDHDHHHHDDDDDQGAWEQIFQFIGTKSQKTKDNNIAKPCTKYQADNRFMKLPCLESSPNNSTLLVASFYESIPGNDIVSTAKTEADPNSVYNSVAGLSGLGDWATLDRLVATHLNGQTSDDTIASIFTPSSTDHHHHLEHDVDQLPPLRSSSTTPSSSGDKVYHPNATTLDNYGGNIEIDLWSLTRLSSSPLCIDSLCHVSENGI